MFYIIFLFVEDMKLNGKYVWVGVVVLAVVLLVAFSEDVLLSPEFKLSFAKFSGEKVELRKAIGNSELPEVDKQQLQNALKEVGKRKFTSSSPIQRTADPDCMCGDIKYDYDGEVGLDDFTEFAGCFGSTSGDMRCGEDEFFCSDLDGDGVIGLEDFVLFSGFFGEPVTEMVPPNCEDKVFNPELIGFVPGLGDIIDVTIVKKDYSTYAHLASNEFGLVIVDVTDPLNPTMISTLGPKDVPASAMSVASNGETTVIGGGFYFPTKFVNVRDLSTPSVIHTLAITASDVAIDESHAYIASGSQGLKIVDLNALEEPVSSVPVTSNEVKVMKIDNKKWAFVTSGHDGLKIVEISNPKDPILLELDLPVGEYEIARDVALHVTSNGEVYAYVVAMPTVYIINVTNPLLASEVGTFLIEDVILDISISNGFLTASISRPDELRVWDLAVPEAPVFRSALALYNVNLFSDGPLVYTAGRTLGLRIVNINDPDNLNVIGTIASSFNSRISVAIDNSNVVVGSSMEATRILTLSPDNPPSEVGTIPFVAGDVAIYGSYAYIAARSFGLKIANLEDLTGDIIDATSSNAQAVEVMEINDKKWAFIASGHEGLKIVDVSNLENPILLELDFPVGTYEHATDVALHVTSNGEVYAYVVAMPTIYIINVTNPYTSTNVGSFEIDSTIIGISISEGYLVVGVTNEIRVFDLVNPKVPTPRGTLLNHYNENIDSDGVWVFTAGGTLGLRIVDISDPDDPILKYTMPMPGRVSSIARDGETLILGDNVAIIDIIDLYAN